MQEAEHQIVTAYEIHAARPADVTLWTPALDRHQTIFGRAPDLAAGDRGFSRRPMNRRRPLAVSDASSCRGAAPSRPRGARMNTSVGSVGRNDGVSAVKAASVCTNADMDWTAVATMAQTACIAGLAYVSSRTIW